MRTNIEIDDALMAEALAASGCQTKKQAVEQALKVLIKTKRQSKLKSLKGKITWEGSLELMRSDT